ncbi:uncharacterized protein [Pseudorasbora parva]|uniref:uncharacterized protein n=1 Tax=Pseudorasbora parva TaxID=51549 RepID=UPI00351F3174
MKSYRSKGDGPNFSEKTPSPSKSERSDSPVFSSLSMKSYRSKGDGPNFSEKTPSPSKSSHVSRAVSVKSDQSEGEVANLKTSPYKSDKEQKTTVNIGAEFTRWQTLKLRKGLKSDVELASLLLKGVPYPKSNVQNNRFRKNFRENLHWIFQDVENKIITFLKNELKYFRKILKKDNTQYYVKDLKEEKLNIKEAALDMTLFFLRDMKQDEAANTLEEELVFINQQRLISRLKKKYQSVSEGIAKHGDNTLLNNIYTDLYITQGGSEQVNTEHEVSQIEAASRRHESQEIQVECTHLFEASEDKEIRTVLTKGVAGIGKSISVQKFIVDWAERLEKDKKEKDKKDKKEKDTTEKKEKDKKDKKEKDTTEKKEKDKKDKKEKDKKEKDKKDKKEKDTTENLDISFIFPLPFREINLIKDGKQSLMNIISQFFPETKGLDLTRNKFKILFILDGLDECRLPLDFKDNETWSDVTSPACLDVLLTNLIKGNLLPSALIWITTRPAAASKIPPECIDRLTEVRGFNDEQKEEYFKKRFTDEKMAKEIIDHVKQSKSLFIMCHIPVFCWISATVLQNILEEKITNDKKNNQADETSKTLQESNTEDTPKTLTQMYTHFLRFQILQSRRKYDGEYTPDVSWDKDAILSLGKLAFQQLKKNNLIFCNTDLESCGIDVYKASVYSGMCTQIFKEETGIIVGTMYCFVHMSIQEFIAALYAHLFLDINTKSVFVHESTEQENKSESTEQENKNESTEQENKNEAMIDLLKTAVDEALESETGHLDLFLRFLLGLSLQSNQRLLRGLLTPQNDQSKEIVQYIKQKLEDNLSPERSINLFYCLNELNDQTLVKEIQNHLREGSLSSADLSPAQWSAVAFVLLTSEEELEEFELQKFKKSEECFFRLSEVVKNSKRALLNDCDLTDKSCSTLAKALRSDNNLKYLNMNNNNLQDSGLSHLCTGLENITCKLETLWLSKCYITEESCSALASVLSSDSSSLKDLDLSNNNLKDSGVMLISNGLEKNKKLEKLKLSVCSITEEGYKALASALRSNPSHLIELDLTGNDPGQSGVKELDDLLQDQNCQLKTLRFLSPAADEACQYVSGVVGENLLLMRELNLSGCVLGHSGLKKLAVVLEDKHCKMKILILNNSYITEEDCRVLTAALNSNPSNLKELNLSGSKLRNTGMKVFSTLFENKECRLENLKLTSISITEEGCAALTSAFNSNPSNLIELDLSENKLGDFGVTEISTLLGNSQCTLQILRLSDCSITEEGYNALTSALRSNPSHLIELDLTGNDPGQSGVKELDDIRQNGHYKLKTIRFLKSPAAEEACEYLTKVLGKSPLLLTELDLSEDKLGDLDGEKLSALLMDSHCKLEKIKLNNCELTETSCSVLATVLSSKTILKEMNLNNSRLLDSGIKEICEGLKKPVCELKILKLSKCYITEESCSALASVLSSDSSSLKDLDLSNNNLKDSGVMLLSDQMKENCKLERLRLSDCSISEEGYKALASALRSNPSHLIELDLTGNDPGQSGVKELDELLQDQNCQLKTLRFLGPAADEACQYVTGIVGKNPLLLRELNLSKHKLGDTGVNQISALLKDKHCKLNTLQLNNNSITAEGCAALTSAFNSNPSNLIELDLSGNKLGDSGIIKICQLLENTHCRLEKLKLSDCQISGKSYKTLTSSLKSNSHLIELDLTGNDPGKYGVKELTDLLRSGCCKLKNIRFLKSPAAQEACEYLSKVLDISPLLLTELDLSKVKLGDLDGQKLSALLMDSHSKLEKIKLNNCELTEKSCSVLATVLSSKTILNEMNLNNIRLLDSGVKQICEGLKKSRLEILKLSECDLTEVSCSALASVLSSDSSCLKELDLSNNNLQDSGVKLLSDGLKEDCRLERLRLSDCCITEEGYKALASALRSNPSHLIELDLTGNDPGQSGVKELDDLLQDQNCQLKTLRFLSPAADEACQYVRGIVGKNPLFLKELNLSGPKLGDTRVNQISALLNDKHCKLNALMLNNNSITAEGCAALTSAFNSNPSNLTELDLSENKLGDSGMEKICHLLKNTQCRLKKLKLSDCSITEEGYKALASALRSNPSHLIELDLTGNDPGQSGVKELEDLLQDECCTLKTIRFLGSPAAQEACDYLTKDMGRNPLLLTELDLSEVKLGDLDGEKLSALLMDSHCKLEKIKLNNCELTEKSCSVLATILSSKTILKEMDLNNIRLLDSGVKEICKGLKNPVCELKILKLSDCSISEEGYKALASALRSNPSHLIELDLTGNDPGESGVKELTDLLQDQNCQLKTLR